MLATPALGDRHRIEIEGRRERTLDALLLCGRRGRVAQDRLTRRRRAAQRCVPDHALHPRAELVHELVAA